MKCFRNKNQNKTVFDLRGVMYLRENKNRIVFGWNADYHEAPWAVYIRQQIKIFEDDTGTTLGFCTGVLITFQWVLTAAHCYS